MSFNHDDCTLIFLNPDPNIRNSSSAKAVTFATRRRWTTVGSVAIHSSVSDAQVVNRAAPSAGPRNSCLDGIRSEQHSQSYNEGEDDDDALLVHAFRSCL